MQATVCNQPSYGTDASEVQHNATHQNTRNEKKKRFQAYQPLRRLPMSGLTTNPLTCGPPYDHSKNNRGGYSPPVEEVVWGTPRTYLPNGRSRPGRRRGSSIEGAGRSPRHRPRSEISRGKTGIPPHSQERGHPSASWERAGRDETRRDQAEKINVCMNKSKARGRRGGGQNLTIKRNTGG